MTCLATTHNKINISKRVDHTIKVKLSKIAFTRQTRRPANSYHDMKKHNLATSATTSVAAATLQAEGMCIDATVEN